MRREWMVLVAFAASGCAMESGESIGSTSEELLCAHPRTVRVRFEDCTEFAGLTPVPLENVEALVPSHYEIAGAIDGVAVAVFRSASCESVRIDGGRARAGVVAQVGVNVVAPTGEGDINNYTLYYATDSLELFVRLRLAGVNAGFVPGLVYEYTPNAAGTGGDLFVDVSRPRNATYELSGPESEPVPGDPGFPFVANWWRSSRESDVVMSTTIPNIRFGDASAVTVTTDDGSRIAEILGATSASFPVLSVRGVFASADMEVRREAL
jgi:hypothetical protein